MEEKLDKLNRLRGYLRTRSKEGEKDLPRIFVGREREIKMVLDFQEHWEPGRTAAQTHIIAGAPGAGKTSLVAEMAKEWRKREGAAAIVWNEVPVSEEDVRALCREIAVALGAMSPDEDRITYSSESMAGANLGVVKGDLSSGQSVAPPQLGNPMLIPKLPGYDAKEAKQRRVAVFIDEIQNLPPDETNPGAVFVRDLHTQQDLPILLVCAGLADSRLKLKEAKITRTLPEHEHYIGGLPLADIEHCARANLEHARHEGGLPASEGAIERWTKELAEASDRWPRHLHCYLSATWATLLEMQEPDLDRCKLKLAKERGDDLRTAYYEARVEGNIDISILHALTQALPKGGESEGIHQRHVIEMIGQAVEQLPLIHKEAHNKKYPLAEDCLNRLLHNGIVTHDRGNRYAVPIPSLAQHIESEFNLTVQ